MRSGMQSSGLSELGVQRGQGGGGGMGAIPPKGFGKSVNPKATRLCPLHYYLPPVFSELPTALQSDDAFIS